MKAFLNAQDPWYLAKSLKIKTWRFPRCSAITPTGRLTKTSSPAAQVRSPPGWEDMGRQRGGQPNQRRVDLLDDGLELFQERASLLAGSAEEGVMWPETAFVEVVNHGRLPAGSSVEDVDGLLEAITCAWKGAGLASVQHRLRSKRFAFPYFMTLALSGAYACTIHDRGRIEVRSSSGSLISVTRLTAV
jgi:hypothetical protein